MALGSVKLDGYSPVIMSTCPDFFKSFKRFPSSVSLSFRSSLTLTGLTNNLGEMLLIAPRIFISVSSIYLATIVLYCKRWLAEAIRLAHNWGGIMNKEGENGPSTFANIESLPKERIEVSGRPAAESHSALLKEPVTAVMA
ncbi:MAG: hypothetical protein NTY37_02800 [Methanothrix sp.]|nr:hypothetical protein [Methanothrix sp.]